MKNSMRSFVSVNVKGMRIRIKKGDYFSTARSGTTGIRDLRDGRRQSAHRSSYIMSARWTNTEKYGL